MDLNKNNNSNADKILGRKNFIKNISYTADGGGDSLNEEDFEFNVKGIDGVDPSEFDELKKNNHADSFFLALSEASDMSYGWYNDDGGRMGAEINFEKETLSFFGEFYFVNGEDLESYDKVFDRKMIGELGSSYQGKPKDSGSYLRKFIDEMNDNSIFEVEISFYGSGGDADCDLMSINGNPVKYKTDEYNLFKESKCFLMDIVEEEYEGFFEEEGGGGELELKLSENKEECNISISLEKRVLEAEGKSSSFTFSEILENSNGEFDEVSKMIDVAIKVNSEIIAVLEHKEILKILEKEKSRRLDANISEDKVFKI